MNLSDEFGLNIEREGKSVLYSSKEKNSSFIKLTPMNLKIKSFKKKKPSQSSIKEINTNRSAKSKSSRSSISKTERKMFQTQRSEYSQTFKRSSSKSSIKSKNKNYKKVGEGKEERRKTICEEYYGFKN